MMACQPTERVVQPSFYYWKTSYRLSAYEQQFLTELGTEKIYFRAFDVLDMEPVGVLQWADSLMDGVEYIPVVFIDKEVFRTIDSSQNIALAQNVFRLIEGICHYKNFEPKEIQIDCDWTRETKQNYFAFLVALKNIAEQKISVTIRLHQIKFAQRTGIPPCDYGVLMCYNMGNIKSPKAKNSIYEQELLRSYLKNASYNLPLKPALPIFEWLLWYRGEQFMGILPASMQAVDLVDYCTRHSNVYTFHTDTTLSSLAFKKGDCIRDEAISQTKLAALKKYLRQSSLNLSDEFIYFSLDSANIQDYEESIFTN